ncbi:MAG: VOC family protein [Acidobacteria bacterium]|nr:VOC family protein [Acidobacteriota bacterium]
MHGIHPYAIFNGNCREAIEFYKKAIGAEVMFIQTVGDSPMKEMGAADKIMHATLKFGPTQLMMSDDLRPDSTPSKAGNISLAIGVVDRAQAESVFAGLSEGATITMPLEKTYWAEAFGMLTDKFGIAWMINCEAPR